VDRFLCEYNVDIHQWHVQSHVLRITLYWFLHSEFDPTDDDDTTAMREFLQMVFSEEECRKYNRLTDPGLRGCQSSKWSLNIKPVILPSSSEKCSDWDTCSVVMHSIS